MSVYVPPLERMVWRVSITVFLLLLVGFLMMAKTARADNCRHVGSYVAPTYTATNYQHAYQPTYQTYQTLVPYVQAVAVNPDFYFSVGDEYRQLAFAKLIAAEYAKMVPAQAPNVANYPVGPPQQQPQAAAMPLAAKEQTSASVRTALPPGLREMVEKSCQKCHSSGKGQQLLDLTNLDTLYTLPLATRDRMFRSVSNGRMPKGGKSAEGDLDLFNAYAALAEQVAFGTASGKESEKK